jgi:drug/metabolite transporter (DMT)-like permease
MIVGIATGLGAALLQALSYLATRYFVHGRGRGASRQLLVLGHIWMGIASLVLLAIVWPGRGFSPLKIWNPLLSMIFFYMVGQVSVTIALRYVEASRASPLQGIKIIFLAAMAAFVSVPRAGALDPPGLTWMQWLGAGLAVVAAATLNYAGTAIPRKAFWAIIIGCAGYALADWNIARTNVAIARELPGFGAVQSSLLNVGLCYGITGVIGLVAAPFWGSWKAKDWRDASPFAATWFVGMLALYWCYAEVGPLLGAILQSSRGLMSILLGSLLVWWGHHHIEPHGSRGMFFRRLAAGLLMFIAVTLYVIRDPERLRIPSVPSTKANHG